MLFIKLKMNIEVFRYADWDGIVGLGYTLDNEPEHKGYSIID